MVILRMIRMVHIMVGIIIVIIDNLIVNLVTIWSILLISIK